MKLSTARFPHFGRAGAMRFQPRRIGAQWLGVVLLDNPEDLEQILVALH